MRLFSGLIILLAAATPALAQKEKPYPADGVIWTEDWDKATGEAVARNIPIVVLYLSDAKACTDTADEFKKPSFIQASRNYVNYVICKETGHGTQEAVVNGKKDQYCKMYWGIKCEDHVKAQGAIQKISKEQNFTIPLAWFCDTTGKKSGEKVSSSGALISGSEISSGMDKVMKTLGGNNILWPEWQGYMKARRDLAEGMEKGEYKRAMAGALALQKAKTKLLQVEGKEAMNKLSEKGDELLKEASDLIPTDKEKAKKQLQMLASDFKPLICSGRAADLLKSIK